MEEVGSLHPSTPGVANAADLGRSHEESGRLVSLRAADSCLDGPLELKAEMIPVKSAGEARRIETLARVATLAANENEHGRLSETLVRGPFSLLYEYHDLDLTFLL